MKKVEVIVDGLKHTIVTELDEEYYETNEPSDTVSEDTLDLTDELKNLENTIVLNKDEINGKNS